MTAIYQADLATERQCQLTTGKRLERTERCPIYGFAIVQASCLICAGRHQLTFPFCFAKSA